MRVVSAVLLFVRWAGEVLSPITTLEVPAWPCIFLSQISDIFCKFQDWLHNNVNILDHSENGQDGNFCVIYAFP